MSRPLPPKLLPRTSPPGPARARIAAENLNFCELWACERAVSLRTQGNSATGALAVGVRAQSSRCRGRSSAQFGSRSKRLMPLPVWLLRRPPPTRRSSPVAAAICGAQPCRSVLSASASLGLLAPGCSFLFPNFSKLKSGVSDGVPPSPKPKQMPKPFGQTRKRAVYLQTWFPKGSLSGSLASPHPWFPLPRPTAILGLFFALFSSPCCFAKTLGTAGEFGESGVWRDF